jgi:hypothetical protein
MSLVLTRDESLSIVGVVCKCSINPAPRNSCSAVLKYFDDDMAPLLARKTGALATVSNYFSCQCNITDSVDRNEPVLCRTVIHFTAALSSQISLKVRGAARK